MCNAACHSEVEKVVLLATSHNVVIIPFGGKFILHSVQSVILIYVL